MKFSILVTIALIGFTVFADNRSDQMNPNNDAYYESRGYDERPDDWETSNYSSSTYSSSVGNNRSNQLNPNNDAYYQSRGYDERPDDWDSEDAIPYTKSEYDNHSNQLNSNNDTYWKARDIEDKPKAKFTTNINSPNTIESTKAIALVKTENTDKDISLVENNSITKTNYEFSALKLIIHFLSIR